MKSLIRKWLTDVVDDPVTLLPDECNGETRANCWSFSLSSQEASELTSGDLAEFIYRVVAARKQALIGSGIQRGTVAFYCWFDEQASQLRFSMASTSPESLPFGCRTSVVLDLGIILERFLRSPYHDCIPFQQLMPTKSSLDQAISRDLEVWVEQIP